MVCEAYERRGRATFDGGNHFTSSVGSAKGVHIGLSELAHRITTSTRTGYLDVRVTRRVGHGACPHIRNRVTALTAPDRHM